MGASLPCRPPASSAYSPSSLAAADMRPREGHGLPGHAGVCSHPLSPTDPSTPRFSGEPRERVVARKSTISPSDTAHPRLTQRGHQLRLPRATVQRQKHTHPLQRWKGRLTEAGTARDHTASGVRSEGDTGLLTSGTDHGSWLTDWLLPWSSPVLL